MIEVHMEQQAEGRKEDVAIIFSVDQLQKLQEIVHSTYIDAREKGQRPEEIRYLKVSGVIRRP